MSVATKICGVRTAEDAAIAVNAGASYVGMIFAESKRKVPFASALDISRIQRKKAQLVGVFQNQSLDFVNSMSERLNLDLVQLHGDEDNRFVSMCTRPAIKVFRFTLMELGNLQIENANTQSLETLLEFEQAKFFLFDRCKTDKIDSDREVLDRVRLLNDFIQPIRARIPDFFLAGSLTNRTVASAIDSIKPYGVDVSSGVESETGFKSAILIKSFIRETMQSVVHR